MTRGIVQKLLLTGIATGLWLMSSEIDAADKWNNIPQDTSSFGVVSDSVPCCYDSDSKRIYATWGDGDTPYSLRSAYFDGSNWTNINQDTSAFGAIHYNVSCCYDSDGKRIYAAWRDNSTPYSLRSAYFDGSNWTNIVQDTSSFGQVWSEISCCYDSDSKRIYATWRNNNPPYSLRSAYFDGSNWTDIVQDTSSFGTANENVSCCYDSDSKRIYATWRDNYTPYSLKSAYFDGSNWTNITQDTSAFGAVNEDVSCCYDSDSKRIYAAWADKDSPHYMRSAYYDGTNWVNIAQDTSSFGQVYTEPTCCYDRDSKRIYAVWDDNDEPYSMRSAYYDGTSWVNIAQDTSSFGEVSYEVYCCYDSNSKRIYAAWRDYKSPYSMRSAFYGTNTLSLTGTQKSNDFAVVSEQFNALSWQSLSPQASSYQLERNGVTIEPPLGSKATSYEDHNRISTTADTYLLTALDALGNPIATDTITIKAE